MRALSCTCCASVCSRIPDKLKRDCWQIRKVHQSRLRNIHNYARANSLKKCIFFSESAFNSLEPCPAAMLKNFRRQGQANRARRQLLSCINCVLLSGLPEQPLGSHLSTSQLAHVASAFGMPLVVGPMYARCHPGFGREFFFFIN